MVVHNVWTWSRIELVLLVHVFLEFVCDDLGYGFLEAVIVI
jgi:hypothetical protein